MTGPDDPSSVASALPVALARVSVRFGDRTVLHDVDLTVQAGEFVVLAGPNGSGKTTLLRVLLGFVEPSGGRVELFGTPTGDLTVRERARRVGWVPQEEAPRDNPTVREYLRYGRYPHVGRFEAEGPTDQAVVDETLRELELDDRADGGILELSGGERQRAVLGRALVQATPLLLLDEPTSHLDIGHQLDLLERVQRLARRRGTAVLAALHDLNLAARYADRIVVLSRGRKFAEGPPGDVLSEQLLASVWGVVADLRRDPRSGAPYLLPHRRLGAPVRTLRPSGLGPVHVVGGGGAASPILRSLVDEGFSVTTGALHLLDTDAETGEALSIPMAVEVPFAPLGEEVRAAHRRLLQSAAVIVVAPFAIGPSNLANLTDVEPFVARVPTFLVGKDPVRARDFASGEAERGWNRLREAGAEPVPDLDELLLRLRSTEAPASSAGRAGPAPPT